MKVSGIDKDFINIISYLLENGFKTFASCDGVLANHVDKNEVTKAYIAFMQSPRIIELMSAFLRDKENFSISVANSSHKDPHELYDNIIEGNRFSVFFSNRYGELTSYFEKIIKGLVENKIVISDEEKSMLQKLSECLENGDNDTDLDIIVKLNFEYQPFMKKEGKTNYLTISTKDGYSYYRNMGKLVEMLSTRYGIPRKECNDIESFEENDFLVKYDESICEIYFSEENFEQIFDYIQFIKSVGPNLPMHKAVEPDFTSIYEEYQASYYDGYYDDEEPDID